MKISNTLWKSLAVTVVLFSPIGTPAFANTPEGKGKAGEAMKQASKKNKKDRKNKHGQDDSADSASLVIAGMTAAGARLLAPDYCYQGLNLVFLHIKNLARGKPLSPGIAKK